MINTFLKPQSDNDFDYDELSRFWDEEVHKVIVDRGSKDDREQLEM